MKFFRKISSFIDNIYWFIHHRIIDKHHIIKTGLKPGYYDINYLMIHGLFSLLCKFVEKEYSGVDSIKSRIDFLLQSKIEEIEIAITNDNHEAIPYITKQSDDEIEALEEAIRLYKWWVLEYPYYDDNDPYLGKNNTEHLEMLIDDEGYVTFKTNEKIEQLLREHDIYEKNRTDTITKNMVSLVNIRNYLWS